MSTTVIEPTLRLRAKMEKLESSQGISHEIQGPNLSLNVLNLTCSLDSGLAYSRNFTGCKDFRTKMAQAKARIWPFLS